jgi:hypothetical protein
MSIFQFVTVSARAPPAGDPAGQQIVDFNGNLSWDSTIGPEGISRARVGGLTSSGKRLAARRARR